MQNLHPTNPQASDAEQAATTDQPTPTSVQQESIHLFTDIDWQSEEEPPYPIHSKRPELYNLLTVTGLALIGYYPHDTHELNRPDSHFLAWAPLHASETTLTLH